jgi:hypothetical protein
MSAMAIAVAVVAVTVGTIGAALLELGEDI